MPDISDQDWYSGNIPGNATLPGQIPIGKNGPGIGGDAPWSNTLINTLVGLGSAFGTYKLQEAEVNNAYKYAALNSTLYYTPGRTITGVPGVPGAPSTVGAGQFALDPMMIGMIALVGLGAVLLLRKG